VTNPIDKVVMREISNLPKGALVWWCLECGRLASSSPKVGRQSKPIIKGYIKGSMDCKRVLNSGTAQEYLAAVNV